MKGCEIWLSSQKSLCCSACSQDIFQNCIRHNAHNTKVHIFLLFLGWNSLSHNCWFSIKATNNYFYIIFQSILLLFFCTYDYQKSVLWTIETVWDKGYWFLQDQFSAIDNSEKLAKNIMVVQHLCANAAHSLAYYDGERLSSKYSLLQLLLLQKTLQKRNFSLNFKINFLSFN